MMSANSYEKVYQELYMRKDAAFDRGEVLSWDYDQDLLNLIRRILMEALDRWHTETNLQRRKRLYILVKTSQLLSRKFKYIYNANYGTKAKGSEYTTIWDNLVFLLLYRISTHDPRFYAPFLISSVEINDILQELFCLIDPLNKEIEIGLGFQQVFEDSGCDIAALPPEMQNIFQQHDKLIRQLYRDPHKLPLLEAMASYGREKRRLNVMLRAIQLAINADVSTDCGRMAFLRQLQILGESWTGQNISKPTLRLGRNINWKLLQELRNKLSHNEWDIHSRLLLREASSARLEAIKIDLVRLEVSIQEIRDRHRSIGDLRVKFDPINAYAHRKSQLLGYYNPGWYLRPATKLLFFDFIRDCYINEIIVGRGQLIEIKELIVGYDLRDKQLSNEIIQILFRNLVAVGPLPRNAAQQVCNANHDLIVRYYQLEREFNKDVAYYENLENPDRNIPVAHRLDNIRALRDALRYTADTYNSDRTKFIDGFSFSLLHVKSLIVRELTAIKRYLTPLQGSSVITQEISEDTTGFQDDQETGVPLRAALDDIKHRHEGRDDVGNAIEQIIQYYRAINRPILLEFDGLRCGITRGTIQTITLTIQNLSGFLEARLQEIVRYGNRCQLYNSLATSPQITEACFYHMARIQKYLVVLDRLPSHNFLGVLSMFYRELKELRNFIHHGSINIETSTIEPLKLMVRYASFFLVKVEPAINQMVINPIRLTRFSLVQDLPSELISMPEEQQHKLIRRKRSFSQE